MNVTCPQCTTVYRVDPRKIPPRGVRARCENARRYSRSLRRRLQSCCRLGKMELRPVRPHRRRQLVLRRSRRQQSRRQTRRSPRPSRRPRRGRGTDGSYARTARGRRSGTSAGPCRRSRTSAGPGHGGARCCSCRSWACRARAGGSPGRPIRRTRSGRPGQASCPRAGLGHQGLQSGRLGKEPA